MQSDEALRRAQFAITHQAPAEAERLAADILKADPAHLEATKIRGYALLMLGRAADAIEPLEKLADARNDPRDETQLAVALRQIGRREDAVTWLNRATARNPPFAPAFHELGFVLSSLQRYGEAIAVLKRGLDVAPTAEIALHLGYAHNAIGERTPARKYFTQALAIDPRSLEALHAMGTALMDERDFAQAAGLFRRALKANPADAAARIQIGVCLLSLGDTDGAYASLRAAAAQGPQFFGKALKVAVSSGRGRFWLHPSEAAQFFKNEKSGA